MGGFSRSAPPSAVASCANPCIDAKARDQILMHRARERARALGQHPQSPPSPCQVRAQSIPAVADRMERYGDALPGARAARDLNELGDAPGRAVTQPCLTRLPLDAPALNRALGIDPNSAGAIQPADLRDDRTGFRAALYRDDTNGQIIMVARDTQPHSLVDWQTNIYNGAGRDTAQYSAARRLSSTLAANDINFDIAGYSKGGGLAQEAGLMSPGSRVYVFNSAGLSPASLARTGQSSFNSLASRTSSFSAQHDFLTYMNNTANPAQRIVNAQYLRDQLVDPSGLASLKPPMQIQYANPATSTVANPAFAGQRDAFIRELDGMIAQGNVNFPPVRAGRHDVIPNSIGSSLGRSNGGWPFSAGSDQPTLGKLAQHQITNVVGPDARHPGPMEQQIAADRETLRVFHGQCGG